MVHVRIDKKNIILSFLVSAFVFSGVVVFAAWSNPTAIPPENNVDAPLNVGPTAQIKTGDLTVKMLFLNPSPNVEGDIKSLNLLEGYNDLLLYGNSTKTAPIYLEGSSIVMNNDAGTGNVGIKITSPNTALDINGALSVREMTAPALAPVDQGRIYFDATANKFKVSENNGAYVDLVVTGGGGAGGWTDGGTNVYLTTSTDNVGIGTDSPITQLQVTGNIPSSALGSVATGTQPWSVYLQGRYAYVVNLSTNTLQIFDVSNPAAPMGVGSIAVTGSGPNAVFVQGRYAYVTVYGSNWLQIFDVSNPAAPVSVGIVSTGLNTSPRGLYVQGRYAYVVTQFGNTLQIYDVANPATPVSVGSVATAAEPSTVFVQGRYAYVTSSLSTTTLQIYDVSSPVAPVSVGTATTGAANSVYVQGRYAYVIATGGTLKIFDVANPASPTQSGSVSIGTGCPTASQSDIFVQGRYAYTIDCNTATLKFVDVSNPASPTVVGSVATGTRPRSVFVQGRYVYVTNELSNTLQVFDAGGAYLQQLEAGGIETGTLATRSNLQVGNDLDVRGGLEVARGIKATGPVAIYSGGSGSTLLSVGNSTFQVNSSGNLTKINNISYSWPASQGGASTILTNDGSGNLSWVAAGGGGTIGGSGTTNYLAKFTASNAIDNSVIYDDGTNIGIGTSSLSSKLTVSGQITGGFGAMTTSGTLDWNDASNARSGNGYSLLMGNATNGPGPAHYYHSFGFEYSSKTGAGNMTQLAIPYNMNYTDGGSNLFIRSRYGGTWGGWRKVLSEDANGRVGIGVLNPTYDLQVAGAIRFEVPAGTHQGPICHNNGELGWCSFNSALTSHVCRSGTTVLGYCSADYSEFMPTVSRQGYLISKGDIVSVANTGNSVFDTTAMFATEKSNLPYNNKIIGVVSPSNSGDGKKVSDDYRPISLIGRVPVNVSTINGEIKAGDAITSSLLAGIGMKATKAGAIVGKALEDFTYDLGKCKDIKRLEEIVWPDITWEENTAQGIEMTKDWRNTCFKLPDETVVGRTLLFVNVSWYEPANEKDEILEKLDQQQKEIENLKLQIEGLKK